MHGGCVVRFRNVYVPHVRAAMHVWRHHSDIRCALIVARCMQNLHNTCARTRMLKNITSIQYVNQRDSKLHQNATIVISLWFTESHMWAI